MYNKKRPTPSTEIIWAFILPFAAITFIGFLVFSINLGSQLKAQGAKDIKAYWHQVIATTTHGSSILGTGIESPITYNLNGKPQHSIIDLQCYGNLSGVPLQPGQQIIAYVNDNEQVYCNQNNVHHPAFQPVAKVPTWDIFLDVFGSVVATISAGFLGWGAAEFSWWSGYKIGLRRDKKKAILTGG